MLVTSALTLFTCSLTLHWLSWYGVSLGIDSVDGESRSASSQCVENNQAKTGIPSGQYQPENVKSFLCSLKQKINSVWTESTQSNK